MQVLGEPGCGFGEKDKAVLDHRGLRVHAHDLVELRLIAGDGVEAVGDQLLDQLGAAIAMAKVSIVCVKKVSSAGTSRRHRPSGPSVGARCSQFSRHGIPLHQPCYYICNTADHK